MSELPPPSGKPVASAHGGDPWTEQARRHALRRAEQRRARRRLLLQLTGLAGLVSALGATGFVVVGAVGDSGAGRGAPEPSTGSEDAAGEDATSVGDTRSSGDTASLDDPAAPNEGGQAAEVVDVWLLDRGDGNFDWGALLSSNSDVVLGDLEVSVIGLDDDGGEVFADRAVVVQLGPDGLAAVGGTVDVEDETPSRVVVTATVGTRSVDGTGAGFVVSDVRRIASGQVGVDDRLLGTIELVTGSEGSARVAAIWRDDDGGVVASVFDDVDRVVVREPAEFSLRLPRNLVPHGEPDAIVVSLGPPG